MRKVKFQCYENGQWVNYEGVFHQFGSDAFEDSNSFVQVTIAICELPDGTVKTTYPERIQFLSPDTSVHTMD